MAGNVTDFVGADIGTLGIEAEFFITDFAGHPVPHAAALLRLIWTNSRYAALRPLVSPEFDARMIEYKTGDGGGPPRQLIESFRVSLWLLIEAAAELNCMLLPTAHYNGPIDHWTHFTDPGGRFEAIGDRYGRLQAELELLQREPRVPRSLALQAHFGIPLGTPREKNIAVTVCDLMTALVPFFASVAANSPYQDMDSRRLYYWTKLPRGGPYLFGDYDGLVDHASSMVKQGLITTYTELWYHERFNKFSLESRPMDMQALFEHLVGLTVANWCTKLAFWLALSCQTLQPRLPSLTEIKGIDLCRLSITRPDSVPLWDFRTGTWTTMEDGLQWLLEFIEPVAKACNLGGAFGLFAKMAEGRQNGAALNRQINESTVSVDVASRVAAENFTASVAGFEMPA